MSSMRRNGDCWDNAVSESFFGTIKAGLIDPPPLGHEGRRPGRRQGRQSGGAFGSPEPAVELPIVAC